MLSHEDYTSKQNEPPSELPDLAHQLRQRLRWAITGDSKPRASPKANTEVRFEELVLSTKPRSSIADFTSGEHPVELLKVAELLRHVCHVK